MNVNKNFIGSRMNKSLDERLIPAGEYTDALNIRISSDEDGEAGSAENAKGNDLIAGLFYNGSNLSSPVCIGALEDGVNETIYWFVTSDTVDMIVSFNVTTSLLKYHVVSTTVLNFNEKYLMNGIDLIDDLLFFTDNKNQPRRIDVNASYPVPVSGVDQIEEDDISVIVKPPVSAPEIQLITQASKKNYIENKFIRFAYRYKYINGEYSAMSEFSDLSFVPKQFSIDYGTYDNKGMTNISNSVNVTFNTGDKRVIGIDLCFKLSNSNVINVVEKFDKDEKKWNNNTDVTIRFDNQKIYTTLPESELLRLYDNVPKFAKTQTSIGNRIMYGNYVDGHNIDTYVNYSVELQTQDVGFEQLIDSKSNGIDYTISGSNVTITDSSIVIDLDNYDLKEGYSLFIDFNIQHDSFGGTYVDGIENSYDESFQFILPRDFSSVSDLATSTEFLSAIELTDESGFPSTVVDGYSLSDLFYSNIQPKSGWTISGGGVDASPKGFKVSYSGNTLIIQTPSVQFEDDANPGTYAYEYFLMSSTTASIVQVPNTASLHSNRDYELGIVYLDEYNRASTALVSTNNTVYVSPEYSVNKNSIQATIKNIAPSWAKRYRFVLKPSKGAYETIYSYTYFYDESESSWWIKLDGDNQTKANVGDRLIVKSDSLGATSNVITTKILDIEAKQKGFITPTEGEETPPFTGLFMKIKPSGFTISKDEINDIDLGSKGSKNSDLLYPTYTETAPGVYEEYSISAGSQVVIKFSNNRKGSGSACGSRYYIFEKTFTATRDYDNFYDFIVGENIDFSKPSNNPSVESSDDTDPKASWIPSIGDEGDFNIVTLKFLTSPQKIEGTTQLRYYRHSANGQAWLGFKNAGGKCNGRNYRISCHIQIFSAGGLLVFETEPADNTDEIYYESHESFPIDSSRYHTGNVQNQTSSQNAIVDVNLYNCFSFGNGVESYKINDALDGVGFNIGARVTAVSEQDYKEAHRYADITYSGIYNSETNVNKLNEFNLGLVNYKGLEKSFGPIQKIHARQTDILCLQEDKISYVLANGKNLFSDASAGGAIYSTPDVLGQQVTRIEDFGISYHPESFAVYGYDVFFTDVKRGAVINLKGGSGVGDQLNVVSSLGMRSWFRDQFIGNTKKFNVGGYDPYMNEYVLSINKDDIEKDSIVSLIKCGFNVSQTLSSSAYTYNVDLTSYNGDVDIDYSVTVGSVNITVAYNGSEVINSNVGVSSGTLTFAKDSQIVNTCTVTITPTNATYDINFGCPQTNELTLIRIVKNTNQMTGLTIGHEYFWSDGSYTSPIFTDQVLFNDGPISLYASETGVEGYGALPSDGSIFTLRYSKSDSDTAAWDFDKFKYLVSDTLYTEEDIDTLTPLLQEASPILKTGTDVYEASFTYSNVSNNNYLYIVWDYVEPIIECSSTLDVTGDSGIYETEIELGTETGLVTIQFDSADIPDRFQIEWDGSIVADSLFVGDHLPDITYETPIIDVESLNVYVYDGNNFVEKLSEPTRTVDFSSSDIAVSDGTETRAAGSGTGQIGVVPNYPSPTALASNGQIKLQFNKQYALPTKAKLIVTGVNSNTGWYVEGIECPTGEPAPCDSGMDVVFLFDYTGSMSSEIEAAKTGAVSIINEINTLSGDNDYRLGLVLADEYYIENAEDPQGAIINYVDSDGYTSLDASQKVINLNEGANRKQVLTAMELMSSNNQTTFTQQINKINNLADMPLGYGAGAPEPIDLALSYIVESNFAGEFRSNVAKYIIMVTDQRPGGDDDIYDPIIDVDEVNRLANVCASKNIKVVVLGSGANQTVWQDLATTTNGTFNTSYDATTIISELQNNCS